jgi:hypothetical protein
MPNEAGFDWVIQNVVSDTFKFTFADNMVVTFILPEGAVSIKELIAGARATSLHKLHRFIETYGFETSCHRWVMKQDVYVIRHNGVAPNVQVVFGFEGMKTIAYHGRDHLITQPMRSSVNGIQSCVVLCKISLLNIRPQLRGVGRIGPFC